MEKGKEFNVDKSIYDIFEDDEDLRDYINTKCMKAMSKCEEYIEKEYSGKYDDDELSVLTEKLCIKAGIAIGANLILTIQKYSKEI
jgi:proline dehydrogenase